MPCACQAGKKDAGKKYTVKKPNGMTYKVYSNKLEADAAAARVGGRVVVG
jgi:hypothetical protein